MLYHSTTVLYTLTRAGFLREAARPTRGGFQRLGPERRGHGRDETREAAAGAQKRAAEKSAANVAEQARSLMFCCFARAQMLRLARGRAGSVAHVLLFLLARPCVYTAVRCSYIVQRCAYIVRACTRTLVKCCARRVTSVVRRPCVRVPAHGPLAHSWAPWVSQCARVHVGAVAADLEMALGAAEMACSWHSQGQQAASGALATCRGALLRRSPIPTFAVSNGPGPFPRAVSSNMYYCYYYHTWLSTLICLIGTIS